ncbi:response regulator [Paenibacillus sp. NPDC058174]|uniref:response regulator n=1 Tax=Paenibacillus sp. NPDC058174 TaxID=3346366 RepID=UPI0036D7CF59
MRKAIIVDDEPIIREGLLAMMDWESLGFEVVGLFEDGEDAWAYLQSHPQIDLVITDIQMDVCTGLELLRKIRDDDYRSRVLIISGYDEFHYLRDAMMMGIDNYLLKPINKEEMESALGQIQESLMLEYRKSRELFEGTQLIKNNILNQIVMNNYSIRDVSEKCEMLSIDLHTGGFQVVVLDTITRQNPVPLLEERQLCEFAIRNVVQDAIGKEEKVYAFGNQNGQTVLLFAAVASDNEGWIVETMNRISGLIARVLKIQVVAFIGRPCTFWREIHHSYESALELYDYRYFVDTSTVIDYTMKDPGTKRDAFAKEIGLYPLYEQLEQQNYESVGLQLNAVGASLEDIRVPELHLLRSVFIDFVLLCMSKLRQQEIEISEHNNSFPDFVEALFFADTKEKLFEQFQALSHTMLQLLQKLKMNRNTNLLEKVIKYIDNYYMEGLSLQQLSQQFHISAPYLGKRLKVELGQPFNEYLHQVRINNAKHLLLFSEYNTKEIAEKVGYTEPNYFYMQFKRLTGKSPLNFKKGI